MEAPNHVSNLDCSLSVRASARLWTPFVLYWRDFCFMLSSTTVIVRNLFVGLTIILLLVMPCMYLHIYIKVKAAKRNATNSNRTVDKRKAKQTRSVLILFILYLFFVVAYVPVVVDGITVFFMLPLEIRRVINLSGWFCGILNSSCNPILYVMLFNAYKAAAKQVLCCSRSTRVQALTWNTSVTQT